MRVTLEEAARSFRRAKIGDGYLFGDIACHFAGQWRGNRGDSSSSNARASLASARDVASHQIYFVV
jgi:hypothetical protein